MQFVDSHGAHPLILSCSDINLAGSGLFFTSNEDEVVLQELVDSDFVVQSIVRIVHIDLISKSVQVQIHAVGIISEFL